MIDKGREFHKVMHDGRNDRRLSSKRHKGISIVLFRRASCGFELAHAHQLHLSSERLASVFINTAQLYRENNAKNNANGSFWKTSPNKSFRFKDNINVGDCSRGLFFSSC